MKYAAKNRWNNALCESTVTKNKKWNGNLEITPIFCSSWVFSTRSRISCFVHLLLTMQPVVHTLQNAPMIKYYFSSKTIIFTATYLSPKKITRARNNIPSYPRLLVHNWNINWKGSINVDAKTKCQSTDQHMHRDNHPPMKKLSNDQEWPTPNLIRFQEDSFLAQCGKIPFHPL